MKTPPAGHMPEIKRIKRHRHLPKVVKKAGQIKAEELNSIKRREENERKHSKLKFERRKNEREKARKVMGRGRPATLCH